MIEVFNRWNGCRRLCSSSRKLFEGVAGECGSLRAGLEIATLRNPLEQVLSAFGAVQIYAAALCTYMRTVGSGVLISIRYKYLE